MLETYLWKAKLKENLALEKTSLETLAGKSMLEGSAELPVVLKLTIVVVVVAAAAVAVAEPC